MNLTNGGEGSPGTVVSKKTRLKLSIANSGRKLTEEHKRKIGISKKGKAVSEKTRLANIKAVSKKVIDLSTGKIYFSAIEVAKEFGIKPLNLTRQLSGFTKNKTNFKYYKNG